MKLLLTLALLITAAFSFAQHKAKFHSQNYIGGVGGKLDAAFQFNTINGVQRGLYFGGIGTGADFYYITTVPLYFSISRYWDDKKYSPFFNLDVGTIFVWDKSTANKYNLYYEDSHFTPSLYYGAHAGYKIGINKKSGSFLMSLGYSAKQIKETLNTGSPCMFPPCLSDQRVDYRFKRFSFRLGWMF